MELTERVARLTANGRTPGLGTLLVGENPSSARYVEMKVEECKEIGIKSFDVHLDSSATQEEIEAVVDDRGRRLGRRHLNRHVGVGGKKRSQL